MRRVYTQDLPDQSGNPRTGFFYLTDEEYQELIARWLQIRYFDEVLHLEDHGVTAVPRYNVHIERSERSFHTLGDAEDYLFIWDRQANDSGRYPPRDLPRWTALDYETSVWRHPMSTSYLCDVAGEFCTFAGIPHMSFDELLYELDFYPHARWAEPFIRKFIAVWEHTQDMEDTLARPLQSFTYF